MRRELADGTAPGPYFKWPATLEELQGAQPAEPHPCKRARVDHTLVVGDTVAMTLDDHISINPESDWQPMPQNDTMIAAVEAQIQRCLEHNVNPLV